MKAQYGFSNVQILIMVTLRALLTTGAWQAVPTLPREALRPDTPLLILIKSILMFLSLEAQRATSHDKDHLAHVDGRWDRAQRRWALAILAALQSESEAERRAAQALQDATLSGSGTEQTQWTYRREADWGLLQLERLAHGDLPAHVALLGLQAQAGDIATTTKELVEAIGSDTSQGAKEARWAFERRIHRELSIALNAAMSHLDLLAHLATDDATRTQVHALRAPLLSLLDPR
jgi:hypothetical protein